MKTTTIRQSRIDLIEQLAAESFRDHVIRPIHEAGVFRHYDCRKSGGGSIYHFRVTTFPGTLVVTGDIGELMLQRMTDMFEWAPRAIHSIDYFSSKVVAGKVRGYDADLVREELQEILADCPYSAKAAELLRSIDPIDQYRTLVEIYDSGLFDDMPSFDAWDSNYLWCREALKWFFAQRGQA